MKKEGKKNKPETKKKPKAVAAPKPKPKAVAAPKPKPKAAAAPKPKPKAAAAPKPKPEAKTTPEKSRKSSKSRFCCKQTADIDPGGHAVRQGEAIPHVASGCHG